jgi:5-methylthioadenosine/S-adenosylhomocysteine deaminase
MEKGDILFKNALVLTMDEQFTQYASGAIVVKNDCIVAVGESDDICAKYTATETVDCTGRILMPGLINAHTHVPMTLLRGLSDDLRLDVWLMGYIMPVEREFVSPEFVKLGTKLACAEMIRGGTTSFADMYYFEDDIAEATAACGMRAVLGQTVLKFPTPDARFYEEGLTRARSFIKKWKNHPLVVPALAPHAPYTCTPEIWKGCVDMAKEFDVPIHTHLAETSFEVESIRKESGMPVIPYMKKLNLFDAKVIAAHCVHVDEGEIRALHNSGVGVAHNPSSNMKLASGASPVKRMTELNVKVGIGTDGPASNNDLDMFEEIRLASFLAKMSSGDPTALPARTVILMATRQGAEALHLGNITGSLVCGKRADMILVDTTQAHTVPRFNRDPNGAYAQIVYSSKSTDVTDTMVNGKWLMRDRQLLTVDYAALVEQSKVYAKKVDAFLSKREQSILSKLIAIGGAMEEESFEIQAKVRIDNPDTIMEALRKPEISIERMRHYREFDTYFHFEDPSQGKIRYREDEFVDEKGAISNVRSRLTLIGESEEEQFRKDVCLSRSRYLAPANNSLRFYREYFQPKSETEIQKDRKRYLIRFKNIDFFVNIDCFEKPAIGNFLEIKSRTWSRTDAEAKSDLIMELMEYLGASSKDPVAADYLDLVK